MLRQVDIDRIIDTYRERKVIDRYSHLATLQEIDDNEYNLNIPRYVNTFEEQDNVDIPIVSKKLKELEKEMSATDEALLSFCNELNIETPF
jgi:type I restriction enzyme M protein